MIDDENFDGAFGRHELQSELLFQGGEDVWEVGVGRPSVPRRKSLQGIVWSEIQIQIEFAGESGLIQDRPVQDRCKLPREVRDVDLAPLYAQAPCL